MMRELLFKAGNPQTQNASISQSQSKLGYAHCNLAQDSTEIRLNLPCCLFKNKVITDPEQRRNFTMYSWNISISYADCSNASDDRTCKHVSLTCAHCTSPGSQAPFPQFILLQNNLEDGGKMQAVWKPSALPFLPNVQGVVWQSEVFSFKQQATFCSGLSQNDAEAWTFGSGGAAQAVGSLSSPPLPCAHADPGAPATQPASQPRGTPGLGGDAAGCRAPGQVALRLGIRALGTCPPGLRSPPLALELYKLPAGESHTRQANKRVPSSRRHPRGGAAMGRRRGPLPGAHSLRHTVPANK